MSAFVTGVVIAVAIVTLGAAIITFYNTRRR